jgi:hypothetical protein
MRRNEIQTPELLALGDGLNYLDGVSKLYQIYSSKEYIRQPYWKTCGREREVCCNLQLGEDSRVDQEYFGKTTLGDLARVRG